MLNIGSGRVVQALGDEVARAGGGQTYVEVMP